MGFRLTDKILFTAAEKSCVFQYIKVFCYLTDQFLMQRTEQPVDLLIFKIYIPFEIILPDALSGNSPKLEVQ
jgi:hypothetical protein